MKIVLLEPLGIPAELLDQLSDRLTGAGHAFAAYDTVETDPEKLYGRAADADVLMLANHPLPDEVIGRCNRLKYISVAFVGVDHVGAETCLRRGIPVSNAAGYCDDAVGELALGLALDCLRNISACNGAVRCGGTRAGLIGHELRGRTVGIIGTGGAGCRTAELYRAFGCRLLGYSRSQRARALELGLTYVDLDTLLRESDIVSVHTPLSEETRGLLNRERIAEMKPTAILINTARGPVVDSAALADALNSGRLAGAGIDVFEEEPPVGEDHPLLTAKHVVATPHVAFATEESLARRAEIAFENVVAWLEGTVRNRAL